MEPFLDLFYARLKIDELISRRYTLDEINVAYDALKGGEVNRSVIVFN